MNGRRLNQTGQNVTHHANETSSSSMNSPNKTAINVSSPNPEMSN
jgi:hypothetical protein